MRPAARVARFQCTGGRRCGRLVSNTQQRARKAARGAARCLRGGSGAGPANLPMSCRQCLPAYLSACLPANLRACLQVDGVRLMGVIATAAAGAAAPRLQLCRCRGLRVLRPCCLQRGGGACNVGGPGDVEQQAWFLGARSKPFRSLGQYTRSAAPCKPTDRRAGGMSRGGCCGTPGGGRVLQHGSM